MNVVSPCCHKPIITGRKKWYPLRSLFYIIEKIDICEGCGNEVEEYAYACENCGVVGCTEGECIDERIAVG